MLWKRQKSSTLARLVATTLLAVTLGSGTLATGALGATADEARTPRVTTSARTLPLPLGRRDVDLYRRIFALQETGDLGEADRLIERLGDRLLLGHVLYQRYMHPTAYRSRYAELARWLERYADHPGARRVYSLALRRRPAGAARPPRAVKGYLGGAGQELQELARLPERRSPERTAAEEATVGAWRARIDRLSARGHFKDATAALADRTVAPLIDQVDADLARSTIAWGHFARGHLAQALSFAAPAAARSGAAVPELHWVAGISAWRLGRIGQAAWHFAALAEAEPTLAAERSRAAFWAARAQVVLLRPQEVRRFLEIAAETRDFYGLLARAALGHGITPRSEAAGDLEDGVLEVLLRLPGAQRALALAQVGEAERAEQEIRKLAARAKPELMVGLIALAQALDLPAAQMRLAQSLKARKGHHHLAALYPVPSWRPARGYTVDRALIFAVVRAESAFDPDAESHAGARGLMQVMPATARYIAARSELEPPRARALFEPETGITFGQAYLEHLLQWAPVGDNLIYLAAAYNAGPARVAGWQERLEVGDDPLLFLESIPMREPRVYVKKVLTNLWTYRARLGQPQPSLGALTRGRWPEYRALDAKPEIHAWN